MEQLSMFELYKILSKDIQNAKTTEERTNIIEDNKDVFDFMRQIFLNKIYNDDYKMVYQPHIENDKCTGAEALFRMNYKNENLNPFVIFAVLRYYGDEKESTSYILENMCKDIKTLSKGKDDFVVSYNINPDFYNREYCKEILNILDKHSVKHENFAVELLEVSSLKDIKSEDIIFIKNNGVKVYLDDFGTGYATKDALNLPFSVVKIDGSLVSNCNNDDKKADRLSKIVALCNAKGMKTLAERVENIDEYNKLEEIGIDKCQGYYFSAGLSIEAFLEKYESNKFEM